MSHALLEHSISFPSLRKIPFAVLPIYSTPSVDEHITVYAGPLCVYDHRGSIVVPGQVTFRWLPSPAYRFETEGFPDHQGGLFGSVDVGDAWIRTLNDGRLFKGHITSEPRNWNADAGHTRWIRGRIDQSVEEGRYVDHVVFHLPNFRDYIGRPVRAADGSSWAGRAEIRFDDWHLIVDEVPQRLQPARDQVRDGGGFSITHVGLMRRRDNRPFLISAAEKMLADLRYFCSFCRGIWTGPVLVTGHASGAAPWLQASNQHLSRNRFVFSWTNHGQLDWLSVLPGFLSRYRSPIWSEAIRNAVHWYIESNLSAGAIQGSMILTQAALEGLAWTLLVSDTRSLSENGYDRLPAEDKIRLLIRMCHIQTEIPPECSDLESVAKAQNWRDGPQALAEIRNCLVHTSARNRKRLQTVHGDAVYDAYTLSLWYLEVTLLYLFGFKDHYSCRLVQGKFVYETMRHMPS